MSLAFRRLPYHYTDPDEEGYEGETDAQSNYHSDVPDGRVSKTEDEIWVNVGDLNLLNETKMGRIMMIGYTESLSNAIFLQVHTIWTAYRIWCSADHTYFLQSVDHWPAFSEWQSI